VRTSTRGLNVAPPRRVRVAAIPRCYFLPQAHDVFIPARIRGRVAHKMAGRGPSIGAFAISGYSLRAFPFSAAGTAAPRGSFLASNDCDTFYLVPGARARVNVGAEDSVKPNALPPWYAAYRAAGGAALPARFGAGQRRPPPQLSMPTFLRAQVLNAYHHFCSTDGYTSPVPRTHYLPRQPPSPGRGRDISRCALAPYSTTERRLVRDRTPTTRDDRCVRCRAFLLYYKARIHLPTSPPYCPATRVNAFPAPQTGRSAATFPPGRPT